MRLLLEQHGWVVAAVVLTAVGVSTTLVMGALHRKRARLVAKLREQAEALALADRKKDEFLGTLAHDLRNLLATMLFSVEGLGLFPPGSPSFHEALDVLGQKVRHMSRLLDDLLEVSRITRDKIQLQKAPLDLGGVVARAVEGVRAQLHDRGRQLSLGLPGEPLRIEGDPHLLEQAFVKLLANAVSSTGPGGRISVAAERRGEAVEVSVKDNGNGIDGASGALGIGLTLAERLVQLHGGIVEARRGGQGQGSEFVVRLPALP